MKTILLLLALAISAIAQTNYPSQTAHSYFSGVIPGTTTTLTTSTVYISDILLVNTTGSAVTVTIQDRSTDCAGAACSFLSSVSIAANTTYTISMGLQTSPGGISWSCSAGASVQAKIHYRTSIYL